MSGDLKHVESTYFPAGDEKGVDVNIRREYSGMFVISSPKMEPFVACGYTLPEALEDLKDAFACLNLTIERDPSTYVNAGGVQRSSDQEQGLSAG